jgi:hypothetical protein
LEIFTHYHGDRYCTVHVYMVVGIQYIYRYWYILVNFNRDNYLVLSTLINVWR